MTTRRNILAGLGLSPLAALPAVAAQETPEERVERLTMELAAALAAKRGKPFRTVMHDGLVIVDECSGRLNQHIRISRDGQRRKWPV